MADTNLNIDPTLLAEFLDESTDMLAGLDSLFVELEANPQNPEPVQAIFRPIHSIKGNSAFFGFTNVKRLAHEMESLLDMVRKNTLTVSRPLIDVLLAGVDELKQAFERTRHGEPEVADEAAFNALVERVEQAGTGAEQDAARTLASALEKLEAVKMQYATEDSVLAKAMDEITAELSRLLPAGQESQTATEIDTAAIPPPAKEILDRLATPLEGNLEDEGVDAVSRALHALANGAPDAAAQPWPVLKEDAEAGPIITDLLDTFNTFVDTVGFDALLQELVLEKLNALLALECMKPAPAGAAEDQAAASTAQEETPAEAASAPPDAKKTPGEPQKTMRIAESHIDTFLNFVGELLVVGDMFSHLEKSLESQEVSHETVLSFRHTNETFADLSTDLQRSIMSIRKVAVRGLLQKVPRMVRDIAARTGKDIAVTLEGEEVEVDKSLIDMLDAPLTHMVRNAADHGIEAKEDRITAGKEPKGNVRVEVTEDPDMIYLAVADDGAGLDLERIREKAQAMGLVAPDQQLREDDIVDLLFSSGVSTAKEVTDVSGRGVGMDVVKRMIQEAGGAIRVETHRGQGSRFRVELPKTVTTQIMSGFLVGVGEQTYVLPMDRVHETTKITKEQVNTVTGRGRCVSLHGRILPVRSLADTLGLPMDNQRGNGDKDYEVMVTVQALRQQFALAVDDVLGVQQVVHREIDGLEVASGMEDLGAVTGGALLGDGTVALVLDCDRLLDRRGKRSTQA